MGIKHGAILIVAGLFMLLSGLYLYSGIRHYNGETERLVFLHRHEFEHVVASIQKNMLGLYRGRLRNIAEVRTDIGKALAGRDREELYRLTQPLYQTFKNEDPFLYVMHYHEPGGHSFLRMHKPDFFGDDLRAVRPAVQHVHNSAEQVSGFEIGRYGAFYRVIQPIFYDGQYVGLLEVGVEARQLTAAIGERFADDQGSFETALFYKRDNWQKATLSQESQRLFGNYVLVSKGEKFFTGLPADFDLAGDQRAQIKIGAQTYIVHRQLLMKNYLGESIGGVIAFQDITPILARKKTFIHQACLFTAVLLGLSYLVLYFFFDKLLLALEQSRKRHKLLLDAAGEGIYGVDLDGRTTFVNPVAERLTGFTVEEIVGLDQHAMFHHTKNDGSPYPHVECPVLQAMREGQVRQVDNEVFWRKDGMSFPVEYVATPVMEDGRTVGAVVVFKDITERKNLEGQLLQSQKMEAVGRLAGGIAHDFNNQLTAILGYGELLRMRVGDDERSRAYVEAIVQGVGSASGLTRQLLAFSRKQLLEMRLLDLGRVVSNISRMIERVIGEDIRLKIHTEARIGQIRADEVQVEQVIMNLVVNARDAMPDGGTLLIETGEMVLDAAYARTHSEVAPGSYVMLVIADTGSGIPPEVRERMFEPFFTTKEHGKGTGIGLATVHGIVKQHNGHIVVYSEMGKGTTFKIFFPRLAVADGAVANTEALDQEGPLPGGDEIILVVDDDEGVRNVAVECLGLLGYQVLAAASAAEALAVTGTQTIDLLLTDLVMPGMNGWDLAQALQEHTPGVRVIMMSGYADRIIDIDEIRQAGMFFLHKPFSSRLLAGKVREALDGNGPAKKT